MVRSWVVPVIRVNTVATSVQLIYELRFKKPALTLVHLNTKMPFQIVSQSGPSCSKRH